MLECFQHFFHTHARERRGGGSIDNSYFHLTANKPHTQNIWTANHHHHVFQSLLYSTLPENNNNNNKQRIIVGWSGLTIWLPFAKDQSRKLIFYHFNLDFLLFLKGEFKNK